MEGWGNAEWKTAHKVPIKTGFLDPSAILLSCKTNKKACETVGENTKENGQPANNV